MNNPFETTQSTCSHATLIRNINNEKKAERNMDDKLKCSLVSADHLFPSVPHYDHVPAFSTQTENYMNVKPNSMELINI